VRFGGEVHHRVGAKQRRLDSVAVGDVALDETETCEPIDVLEIGEVARVRELVEHRHLVAEMPVEERAAYELGADEAGPAGDQDAHAQTATALACGVALLAPFWRT